MQKPKENGVYKVFKRAELSGSIRQEATKTLLRGQRPKSALGIKYNLFQVEVENKPWGYRLVERKETHTSDGKAYCKELYFKVQKKER